MSKTNNTGSEKSEHEDQTNAAKAGSPAGTVITELPICPDGGFKDAQTITAGFPITICPPCGPITSPPLCPVEGAGAQTATIALCTGIPFICPSGAAQAQTPTIALCTGIPLLCHGGAAQAQTPTIIA